MDISILHFKYLGVVFSDTSAGKLIFQYSSASHDSVLLHPPPQMLITNCWRLKNKAGGLWFLRTDWHWHEVFVLALQIQRTSFFQHAAHWHPSPEWQVSVSSLMVQQSQSNKLFPVFLCKLIISVSVLQKHFWVSRRYQNTWTLLDLPTITQCSVVWNHCLPAVWILKVRY